MHCPNCGKKWTVMKVDPDDPDPLSELTCINCGHRWTPQPQPPKEDDKGGWLDRWLGRPWDSLFKDLDRDREAMCIPTLPCVRYTPYGEVEGMKCALGNELNRNVSVNEFREILSDGSLKPESVRWTLGQEATSTSACPTQTYGGNVKLIFDSKKLVNQLRATCYIDFSGEYDYEKKRTTPSKYRDVERGISKEGRERGDLTGDKTLAKYGIGREIYKKECEYLSYTPIPLRDALVRLEYWIPIKPEIPWEASFGCSPGNTIANPEGYSLEYGVGGGRSLLESIKLVREAAEIYGVPFEVKSCFPLLHAKGYRQYIELTQENLEKLKQGIIPEEQSMTSKEIYDREKYPCLCE